MKKFSLLVALLLALSFVFFSCGDDPEEAPIFIKGAPITITNVMSNLIAVGTSAEMVTISAQPYVLLWNSVTSFDGALPAAIDGFNVAAGTPRLLYRFPEQAGFGRDYYGEGYRHVDITMVVVETDLECGSCGDICTNVIARKNEGAGYDNKGDAGYPDLETGTLTLTGLIEEGIDGFSFTKNHGGSAVLVRISSITIR